MSEEELKTAEGIPEEIELDDAFERLKVTPAKVEYSDKTRLELDIAKKHLVKQKRKQKTLLRSAKLVLPNDYSTKKKENLQKLVVSNREEGSANSIQSDIAHHTLVQTPASCSSQYFNINTTQLKYNDEDSSPDELASYFEQILYIPKPMSAMAQMMYA